MKFRLKVDGDRKDAPSSRSAVRRARRFAEEPGRSGCAGRSLTCRGARRMRLLSELGLELDVWPAIVLFYPESPGL